AALRFSAPLVLKTRRATRHPDASKGDHSFMTEFRLTQYGTGGGCSCKIPPNELEPLVAGFALAAGGSPPGGFPVGLDPGAAAAVVRVSGDPYAMVAPPDFFPPVVDDAYDFGRIAATNALSDVYAVGGEPVMALNLLGWPRGVLPLELAREVLRGG